MASPPTSLEVSSETPFRMRTILAPLVAIIIGIFMVILDLTAVNVAVPSLVRSFHSSLSTIQWTITGYALAQAAVIPLAGWLSDRFGAKRIFLTSLVLFTAGSVLCATAQNDKMLITFRVLQGLGGGCVLPIAMAYVYRLSPPQKVGAVMGLMGIPILLAPAIGPVLAGWLVQYGSWRWIFLLNLPIGIIGLIAVVRTLPVVERHSVADLDLPGTILGPLAFAALSYGISQGASSWTSINTIAGLIVGGLSLLAFVAVEIRSRSPLLELRVFRSTDFSLAIVVQWVTQIAMFGTLFLIPLFLQQARGYGAFDTGLILLPQAIAAALFMPIGGMLFDRIGARPLVIAGLSLVALSTFLLSHVSPTTHGLDLVAPLLMMGAGMGLMMMPLNTHIINAAPRRLVSRVTSLTNALQQVVNSLAVAGLATILTARATYHINAVKALAARHPHATGTVPPGVAAKVAHQLKASFNAAFISGFDDTFRFMVATAIVGAVMGFVLRRNLAAQQGIAEDEMVEPEVPEAEGELVGSY
jgi:EmrB/QacA subfamily drug resistance transporter